MRSGSPVRMPAAERLARGTGAARRPASQRARPRGAAARHRPGLPAPRNRSRPCAPMLTTRTPPSHSCVMPRTIARLEAALSIGANASSAARRRIARSSWLRLAHVLRLAKINLHGAAPNGASATQVARLADVAAGEVTEARSDGVQPTHALAPGERHRRPLPTRATHAPRPPMRISPILSPGGRPPAQTRRRASNRCSGPGSSPTGSTPAAVDAGEQPPLVRAAQHGLLAPRSCRPETAR